MKSRGFTLIELSIVLVIIGLVIGGVLVGADLIKAAQTRSVFTEIEKFTTATYTFKTKYACLPGDCRNATDYFGTASGGCPNGTRSGSETCNGNGDGKMGSAVGMNDFSEGYESFTYWQQLTAAGLIAGNYTGIGPAYVFGTNAPTNPSIGGNSGYALYFLGGPYGDSGYYTNNYGNLFYYGSNLGGYPPIQPVITSLQALNIDQKYDDGLPASGNIHPMKSQWNSGCTTSDTDAIARYDATATGIRCSLLVHSKL